MIRKTDAGLLVSAPNRASENNVAVLTLAPSDDDPFFDMLMQQRFSIQRCAVCGQRWQKETNEESTLAAIWCSRCLVGAGREYINQGLRMQSYQHQAHVGLQPIVAWPRGAGDTEVFRLGSILAFRFDLNTLGSLWPVGYALLDQCLRPRDSIYGHTWAAFGQFLKNMHGFREDAIEIVSVPGIYTQLNSSWFLINLDNRNFGWRETPLSDVDIVRCIQTRIGNAPQLLLRFSSQIETFRQLHAQICNAMPPTDAVYVDAIQRWAAQAGFPNITSNVSSEEWRTKATEILKALGPLDALMKPSKVLRVKKAGN